MPVIPSQNLNEALDKLRSGGVNRVIVQSSDATGDISHVAPLLGAFPTNGVLVFRCKNLAFDKRDYIPNVYIDEYGIPQNRVAWVNDQVERRDVPGNVSLDQCTQLLVTGIQEGKKKEIKAVMRGTHYNPSNPSCEGSPSHAKDGLIETFLRRVRILTPHASPDRHWVVLWGRISKEIHVSANSSTLAIAQLARLCVENGFGVILAGDVNRTSPLWGEFELHDKVVYLGRFWKNPETEESAEAKKFFQSDHCEPQLKGRPDQVRLFYVLGKHLKRAGYRLVHVGMRSGGLDAYAFSGQRTLYLLPEHFGDERMKTAVSNLADTKGFAFGRQEIRAPVRQWQYAPQGRKKQGHEAFVSLKLAKKDPNSVEGTEKMNVKDAQERLKGAEKKKETPRGFQPGDLEVVYKRVVAMLMDPAPAGLPSATTT